MDEARASRLQSAAQHAEQMAMARQQAADARKVKTPVYAPAAPGAQNGADVYGAGMEARRVQARRFGSAATDMTNLFGGARPLAA